MTAPDHMHLPFSRKWLALALLAALPACTSKDVVAQVGSRAVTTADLEEFARGRSAKLLPPEALDALVKRELLAEGASRKGLGKRPEVKARLRAAEREFLAQALLEDELGALSDVEARRRYDAAGAELAVRQVHLAHLFFALPPAATAEATRQVQSKATAAWARLLGGDAFEVVAKELSEDGATAATGGDLGVVKEGQVAKEIFEAAASLKAGEASRPVQTPFGFHVLKALAAVEAVRPPFEAVKGQLLAAARREAEVALEARLAHEVSVRRYPERLTESGGAK